MRKHIFKLTHYKNALLKHRALISTTLACLDACVCTFSFWVFCPSFLWDSHIPHHVTINLLNYGNILQNLKKVKGVTIQYVEHLVRNMVGSLYYVKNKESNKTYFLLASKRLIQKSLNLDNYCVKLRAAILFLTNLEYSQSIEICDTFLTFPQGYKVNSGYREYFDNIEQKVYQQLCKVKTTAEIENNIKEILPMFYSSVKLKSLPENYDIAQQNPIWIFRNLTKYVCMVYTWT